jgi:hypothetical protein
MHLSGTVSRHFNFVARRQKSHRQKRTKRIRFVLAELLLEIDFHGVCEGEAAGVGVGSDGSRGVPVGDGVGSDGLVCVGCGDGFSVSVGVGGTVGLTVGSTVGATDGETVGTGDAVGFAVGVTVGDNFNRVSVCGESAAAKIPDNKNKPAPRIKIVFLYIKRSPWLFFDRRAFSGRTISLVFPPRHQARRSCRFDKTLRHRKIFFLILVIGVFAGRSTG